MVKILIFDVETMPKLAYVWRFWQENVGAKQVVSHGYMASFGAKWLDNDEVFYYENRKDDDKHLIEQMCLLLDEADIVVAHNGARFDLPQIRARAVVHGLKPFSPVKMVDTYKVAKKEFGFASNSLEYLGNVLDIKNKKTAHAKFPGFTLWLECLKKNDEAWAEMKDYNIKDVYALEEIYLRMLPWMVDHPNTSIFGDTQDPTCPKCKSSYLHRRGYAFTNVGKFPRFQCQDCGGWCRGRYSLLSKNENLLTNTVS